VRVAGDGGGLDRGRRRRNPDRVRVPAKRVDDEMVEAKGGNHSLSVLKGVLSARFMFNESIMK